MFSGNIPAPFRFLTPVLSFPPLHISEGQWGENRLKAERAWFLTEEVRRAKPETEPLLTRWGKSGMFSDSTGLSFFKHTRRPISSTSLDGRIKKAKSSRSLWIFPKTFFLFRFGNAARGDIVWIDNVGGV